MAIAHVQTVARASAANVASKTSDTFTATPGNALVVTAAFFRVGAPWTPTIADNYGNAWTVAALVRDKNENGYTAVWLAANIQTGSGHTVTVSGTSGMYVEFNVVEFSGVYNACPQDVGEVISRGSGATSLTATAPMSSQADSAVIAVLSLNSDDTDTQVTHPPTNFTSIGVQVNGNGTIGYEAAYRIVSSIAAYSASWTFDSTTHGHSAAVVLLNAAPASAPTGRIAFLLNAGANRNPPARQPGADAQINWSNPITRGLEGAWNFANNLRDAGRKYTTTVNGTAAWAGGGNNKFGFKNDGNSFVSVAGFPDYSGLTEYTVLVFMNMSSTVFDGFGGLYGRATSGDACSFQLQLASTSDGYTLQHGASSVNFGVGAAFRPGLSRGRDSVIVLSWDGTNAYGYIDGTFLQSVAQATAPAASTEPLKIGAARDASTLAIGGTYYCAMVWNRCLKASEIAAIGRNPWQLFAPPRRKAIVATPKLPSAAIAMPAIAITRKTQPRTFTGINWKNPITRGLRVAINGATGFVNLARSDRGTKQPAKYVNRYGGCLRGDGTTTYDMTRTATSLGINIADGPLSGFFLGNYKDPANNATTQYMCSVGWPGVSGWGYRLAWGNASDSTPLFIEFGVSNRSATGSYNNVNHRSNGFSWKAATVGGLLFYLNGAQIGGSVDTGTPISNTTHIYSMGHDGNGGTIGADFNYNLSLVWQRYLSADEHRRLNADPWQVFLPDRRILIPQPGAVIARPVLDRSIDGWAPSSGTVLYDKINEASYDDAGYIKVPI